MNQKNGIQANLRDVIDRACRDELFALELKSKAVAAGESGIGSSEYRKALELFASNEEELRKLTTPEGGLENTTTTTTITTTTTTLACTFTTTTSLTTVTTDLPFAVEPTPQNDETN